MKRTTLCLMFALLMLILGAVAVSAQDDGLTVWGSESSAPILEELALAFEEEFGIPVVVHEVPFLDIRDQFKTAGPAGEGPDILIGAHDWLGDLAVNGLLAQIDLTDVADNFLLSARAAFVFDGVQYGLPVAAENVAFIRNTDLVPENPATWDDVREVSEQLIADGDAQYGWIIQDSDPYHTFSLLTAFGGYVFGLTDDGYDPTDVGMDSDGTIAGAAYMEGYVSDGLMPTGVDYDVMHTLFETGEAAMIITGPWAIPRIEESGVSFAVGGLPAGPGGASKPFLGVVGFMMSAFSENKILAETFLLDFIATEDVMASLYSADPRPPAHIAVRESLDDDIMAGFVAAGTEGLAMPAIPEMASVWAAWANAVTLVRTGELGAEQAFGTAGEQIRALIEGEG